MIPPPPFPNELLGAIVAEISSNVHAPTLSSAPSPARGTLPDETDIDLTADLPADPTAPSNETLYDPSSDETPSESTAAPPPATDPPVPLEETLDDPLDDDDLVLGFILSQKDRNTPYKCYVATTTDPRDAAKGNVPVVWCDLRVPIGLNVTAEIRDGGCDEFEGPSAGGVFARGVASPVFNPEITEEEKLGRIIEHVYCARLDYLYDAGGTGDHARSVLDKRFPMSITYGYREEVDAETGQIVDEKLVDVLLTDENTTADERDLGLILGLSFLAGSIFTVALIAIIMGGKGKKKTKEKQRLQQMMQEGGVDVEITPIVATPKEENDII